MRSTPTSSRQIEEAGGEVEAGNGVVDVVAQIEADRVLQLGHRRSHAVEPRQHEGQRLAEMADDELQFRKCVEHAAEHDADDVDRGLDVPAPAGRGEHVGHRRRKTAIGDVDDALRRRRRMQIDRRIELLGAFQDRPEELVVEIAAAVMAVDDRADEFLRRILSSSSAAALSGAAVGSTASPAKRWDAASPRRRENRWLPGAARSPRRLRTARRRARSGTAPACRCRRRPSRPVGRRRRRRAASKILTKRPPSFCGLFFAGAAGAFEKFRRGEMLFERDRSHVGIFLLYFVGWVERSENPMRAYFTAQEASPRCRARCARGRRPTPGSARGTPCACAID